MYDGHRTVLSQRALQAHADPWLGYTSLDGVGYTVAEVSPYAIDLEWHQMGDLEEIQQVIRYLGRAAAKAHCISDEDSDQSLVPFSTDKAITDAIRGREDEFVRAMIAFGRAYGEITRTDHRLFVDAFRNNTIPGLSSYLGAEADLESR